jgi:hypothetical protein
MVVTSFFSEPYRYDSSYEGVDLMGDFYYTWPCQRSVVGSAICSRLAGWMMIRRTRTAEPVLDYYKTAAAMILPIHHPSQVRTGNRSMTLFWLYVCLRNDHGSSLLTNPILDQLVLSRRELAAAAASQCAKKKRATAWKKPYRNEPLACCGCAAVWDHCSRRKKKWRNTTLFSLLGRTTT